MIYVLSFVLGVIACHFWPEIKAWRGSVVEKI
jgi:hypothetical protein